MIATPSSPPPRVAGPAQPAAGLWRIRAAIVLVYMVFGALLNSVGAVNLLVVRTMGVARGDAALLDAWKDLPIAIVSFAVAALLPRLGLRRAMLLGLAAVTLACSAVPLLEGFWAIKLMYATIGAAFALVKVSAYATVGLVTHDDRSHAAFTSLIEGLFMVGVLAGYLLFSGAVAAAGEGTDWLRVLWLLAGASALSFVLLLASPLDESAVAAPLAAGSMLDEFLAMWRLLGQGLVIVFLLCAFLYVLIEQGVGTWLPSFNAEVLKMPTAMSVGLAVLMPASTALGRLLGSALMARLGWFPVVMGAVLGVAAMIAVTMPLSSGLQANPAMSWSHAPMVAYVIPLMGLFLAPIYPAVNSAMLSGMPKPSHAAVTGLIVIFSALGGSLGSYSIGRLFVMFDGQTAFLLLLLPLALLLVLLVRFRSALQQRRAAA